MVLDFVTAAGFVKTAIDIAGKAFAGGKSLLAGHKGKKALEEAYRELLGGNPNITKVQRLLDKAEANGIESDELDRASEMLEKLEAHVEAAHGTGAGRGKYKRGVKKAAKKKPAAKKKAAKKTAKKKPAAKVRKKPAAKVKKKPAAKVKKKPAAKSSSAKRSGKRR